MSIPGAGSEPLPKDATLASLWPERLLIETREGLVPGTRVRLALVLERQSLPLEMEVAACLMVRRDRKGYVFHLRFELDQLRESDRHLVAVFIAKGRGAPKLERL